MKLRRTTLRQTWNLIRSTPGLILELTIFHTEFHSVEFQSMIHQSATSKEEAFIRLYGRLSNGTRLNRLHRFGYKRNTRSQISEMFHRVICRDITTVLLHLAVISWLEVEWFQICPMRLIISGKILYTLKERSFLSISPELGLIQSKTLNIMYCNRMKSIISWSTRSKLNALVILMESAQPVIRSFEGSGLDVPYRQQDCENSCMVKKKLERNGEGVDASIHHWLACSVGWTKMVSWRHQVEYVKRWCNYTTLEIGQWTSRKSDHNGSSSFLDCWECNRLSVFSTVPWNWLWCFSEFVVALIQQHIQTGGSVCGLRYAYRAFPGILKSLFPINYLFVCRTTMHPPLTNLWHW